MRMTAMLGYARVSTIGQDLDAQLAALECCERWHLWWVNGYGVAPLRP